MEFTPGSLGELTRRYWEKHASKILFWGNGLILGLYGASHFFKGLHGYVREHSLYEVVIILVVLNISYYLHQIWRRGLSGYALRLYKEQHEATTYIKEYVDKHIDEKYPSSADLIELSAVTVREILQALRSKNCQIRLLVQNPNYAINNEQKERIDGEIRNICSIEFADYQSIEVKLYARPGAIRGRLIGDLINVGWYTYSGDHIGIRGHDNPLVSALVDSPEGKKLKEMFGRAFMWLWEDKGTISAAQYLNEKKR